MSQHTSAAKAATGPRTTPESLYGGASTGRRVTVRDIAAAKARGEKWPMLTAYDAMTASVFDEAGVPVLLVGDSAGNCHLGYALEHHRERARRLQHLGVVQQVIAVLAASLHPVAAERVH